MHADRTTMSIATTRRRAALAAVAAPVTVVAAVVGVAGWSGADGDPVIPAVAIAVAITATVALIGTLPVEPVGEFVVRHLRPGLPGGRFHDAASDVAIGLDDPAALLIHHDPAIDVLGLPTPEREVIVVTSGAFDVLTRREVVALAAARLAALRDPWCRVATNASLLWASLRLGLPAVIVGAVLVGAFDVAFVAAGSVAVVTVGRGWPEHARDRCADAVAILTAFDPGGLAGAIRRLSGLGRRRDDLASADGSVSAPGVRVGLVNLPRLAGGSMTTNVGADRRRRHYVLGRLGVLEAADAAVGMHGPVGLEVVSGHDLRRRWAHLTRPVDVG